MRLRLQKISTKPQSWLAAAADNSSAAMLWMIENIVEFTWFWFLMCSADYDIFWRWRSVSEKKITLCFTWCYTADFYIYIYIYWLLVNLVNEWKMENECLHPVNANDCRQSMILTIVNVVYFAICHWPQFHSIPLSLSLFWPWSMQFAVCNDMTWHKDQINHYIQLLKISCCPGYRLVPLWLWRLWWWNLMMLAMALVPLLMVVVSALRPVLWQKEPDSNT